jgi:hypothetical protein
MAGRPRLYNNCLDMDAMCEIYFEECKEEEQHPTVSGLAYALGFTHRHSVWDYANRNQDDGHNGFANVIKRATLRILSACEQNMMDGRKNPSGAIFIAKNFGPIDTFTDKQETHTTYTVTHTVDQLTAKLHALQADPDVQRYLSQQGAIDAQYEVTAIDGKVCDK